MASNVASAGSNSAENSRDDLGATLGNVAYQCLEGLASLKLTVVLMFLGILLVLFGTLAQWDLNTQEAVNEIFRSPLAAIKLKWFFPPKIFPSIPGWAVGQFYFPGGWVIGGLLAANLIAAHAIRFTFQATGQRLAIGLGVIGLGIALAYFVIAAGPDKDDGLGASRITWSDVNQPIKIGLGLALVGLAWLVTRPTIGKGIDSAGMFVVGAGLAGLFGYGLADDLPLWMKLVAAGLCLAAHIVILNDSSPGQVRRIVLYAAGALIAFVLGYLIFRGDEPIIDPSGMRILWQLTKGFAVGITLLAGCILAFKKRAGIVLLHSGILLIMGNELIVYLLHEENRMQLIENQSKNFVENYALPELAFVRGENEETYRTTVVPFSLLAEHDDAENFRAVRHADLPVDVQLVQYWENSRLAGPNEPPLSKEMYPATAGIGLRQPLREEKRNKELGDDDRIDMPAAFVSFLEKGTGKELGVYLVGWAFDQYENAPTKRTQSISIDGKKFFVTMRPKRSYRPYTIKLLSTKRTDYPGTRIPSNYESTIELIDNETKTEIGETRIFMNNPLRYRGETFYQSGHSVDSGVGISSLQVVKNFGWMAPYVGCMIVMAGMCFHFFLMLARFIRRRDEQGSAVRTTTAEDPPRAAKKMERDEGHAAHARPTNVAPFKNGPVPAADNTFASAILKKEILIPLFAVGLVAAFFVPRTIVPKSVPDGISVYEAGRIAAVHEGRVKPLDTVARVTLRQFAQREVVEDGKNEKQPAIRWLLDLITKPEEGERYKIFRVDNEDVQKALGLDERRKELRYTAEELRTVEVKLEQAARDASDVERAKQTTLQKRVYELHQTWRTYIAFHDSLTFIEPVGNRDNLTTLIKYSLGCMAEENVPEKTPRMILLNSPEKPSTSLASYAGTLWLDELMKAKGNVAFSELVDKLLAEERGPLFEETIERSIHEKMFAKTRLRNPKMSMSEVRQRSETQLARLDPIIRWALLIGADPFDKDIDKMIPTDPAIRKDREAKVKASVEQMFVENGLKAVMRRGGEHVLLYPLIKRLSDRQPEKKPAEVADEARRELEKIISDRTGEAFDINQVLDLFCDEFAKRGIVGTQRDASVPPAETPAAAEVLSILRAYRDVNPAAFHEHFAALQGSLENGAVDVNSAKIDFEAYFNYLSPFGQAVAYYIIAFILVALGWLGWFKAFNRAAFWVIVFTFLLHTFALAVRVYLSGRPPITNLYSVSVFIGLGVVAIGILLELMVGHSIGNTLAVLVGIITLQIADYLALEKDTLSVMQAVLDTNFWLGTHVICITTGYAVTYAAAFLGIIYIVRGVFTPSLTDALGKELYRMMYGIVCAAIVLSFFGTVLGGLWGDDSWGRFWGWDPKENGALIIVIWNALVLHARWGGMVKERGFAVLSVIGAIVTTWSYFGVNQLQIGLHSYGFSDGIVQGVVIAIPTFAAFTLIGCLPKHLWWSHRVRAA